MLKRFLISPGLQKTRRVITVVFALLYIYHLTRYYIFSVDCTFSKGRLNQTIEGVMAFFGLLVIITSCLSCLGYALQKKWWRALGSFLAIAIVIGFLWLFLGNVVMECLFYGANMEGFFLAPT